jgi:fructosamine-3-kinase
VVYSTYREHLATSPENEHRMDMYELYHHLNHCVIFGPSYRPGAMRLIRRLLSAASM